MNVYVYKIQTKSNREERKAKLKLNKKKSDEKERSSRGITD